MSISLQRGTSTMSAMSHASDTDALQFSQQAKNAVISRPETKRFVKYEIAIEGWLKKKSEGGIPGMRRWHERYGILFLDSQELRYYEGMSPSNFGSLPLGERGSIPFEDIVDIVVNNDKKWRGCRFDVITSCLPGPYPRKSRQDNDERGRRGARKFCFVAPTSNERNQWVKAISAALASAGIELSK